MCGVNIYYFFTLAIQMKRADELRELMNTISTSQRVVKILFSIMNQ
jgi:preprotein translocase subunit YajC